MLFIKLSLSGKLVGLARKQLTMVPLLFFMLLSFIRTVLIKAVYFYYAALTMQSFYCSLSWTFPPKMMPLSYHHSFPHSLDPLFYCFLFRVVVSQTQALLVKICNICSELTQPPNALTHSLSHSLEVTPKKETNKYILRTATYSSSLAPEDRGVEGGKDETNYGNSTPISLCHPHDKENIPEHYECLGESHPLPNPEHCPDSPSPPPPDESPPSLTPSIIAKFPSEKGNNIGPKVNIAKTSRCSLLRLVCKMAGGVRDLREGMEEEPHGSELTSSPPSLYKGPAH